MPDHEQDHFPQGEKMPDTEKELLKALFDDTQSETTIDQIHALEDALGIKDEHDDSMTPEAYRDALGDRFLSENFDDDN